MKAFELEIITPDNTVFKGRVSSLIFPAHQGYMGVLGGHASFIGALGKGKTTFRFTAEEPCEAPQVQPDNTAYTVKNGFIEIHSQPSMPTKVTILAEEIHRQNTKD